MQAKARNGNVDSNENRLESRKPPASGDDNDSPVEDC